MINKTNKNYYQEKILQEIESVPQEMTPTLYKIIHLLNTQWKTKPNQKSKKRKSLEGIWEGSSVDENLFAEARRSLFSYEDK